MKKILLVAVGSALLVFPAIASATVIDFEDITSDQFDNPLVSEGYNFNFSAGGWGILTDSYTGSGRVQDGSVTLAAIGDDNNGATGSVNFKPISDAPFSMESFDSAVFDGTFATGSITVVGNYEGGGTTSQVFNVTNQWQTFMLDGSFTNLDSITVMDNGSGGLGTVSGFQLDNLTIDSVPEPASLAVLGIGALALVRRRRTSK
ncbi:MAG: PEP-CTERM sorting domain-containing protein [Armatimonadetes bacterium]|nr:PEP-CTERM sorting domain-containing protein [Armatimonadota bacterium]